MHKVFAKENIRRWGLDDAERTVFDIYSQVWTVLMILTQTCSLARLRLCFFIHVLYRNLSRCDQIITCG